LISRFRIGLLAGLVVAVGGAATWGALTFAPRRPAGPPSLAATVTTAVVTRQTISDQQQETGTIGFSASYAVVNQYAPPPSAAQLARDQDQIRAAQQAVADVQAQNALTELQDAAAVVADTGPSQPKLAQDQARQASDLVADAARLHAAQAALRSAQDQYDLDTQPGGSGGGGGGSGSGGSAAVYTSLPASGQTVSRGQTLYAVAGRPIPLLYGGTPIGRRLGVGVSGADVQELEANLIALGYGAGLTADGSFTGADTAAVDRWQAALGVPRTGVVNQGEAVVLPDSLLVAQVKVVAGASAQTGAEIIDCTSTTPVVTVNLDARDRTLARDGESVDVQLPGDQHVKGTIAAVGTVATTSGQGSSQTTTVPVTVTLADDTAAGQLDGAAVTVSIASQTHQNVLTVPITTLLAVPGGGYAVEVAGGTHRRIVVQTGIFSDSRVEVSGNGLVEGMRVESPSL
jgi:Putative peptidoglycan binding domain